MPAPYRLVLLRHGQSEWNAAGVFTGWANAHLTAHGEEEAARAGRLLARRGVLPAAVHTSLQRRTIHTAALAAADRDWIPVRRSWRLNGRHYGALQGQNKAQVLEQYGERQYRGTLVPADREQRPWVSGRDAWDDRDRRPDRWLPVPTTRKALVLMSADSMNDTHRIVVGVDGSPSSRAGLRWAVRQARLTGSTVDALIAWQIPAFLQSSGWAPIYVAEDGDFEGGASQTLETVIGEEVGPADRSLVRARVVNGVPAQALLDAAQGADLLVVGSRGHGGFAEALLGSVSQHCVHHADCPVLIMRGEPAQAAS